MSHTNVAKLPSSFNAGVGGDTIENVPFRLDLGIQSLLEEHKLVIWVVIVGTKNLGKVLRPIEVERYRRLTQTLLRISPTSKILACELFKRRDVGDQYVEESNESLLALLKEVNQNLGERIYWCEAPLDVTKERLCDHVQLEEEGYRYVGLSALSWN